MQGFSMATAVLGGCGTFMVGMATLAAQKGLDVTAFDQAFYGRPQEQLADVNINLSETFPTALEGNFDEVVIGNALGRGHPWVESVLAQSKHYTSGAAWLAEHVLKDRHVLAVAGTHGKTTTSSMLAWILTYAKKDPGFLIGGFANDLPHSAALGSAPYFVVEADEYDTAFWDKRPKFMHYRPNTLILNNLEFDHADIYSDLQAIIQQFKWLLRTVPNNGHIIARYDDSNLQEVLENAHSPVIRFGLSEKADYWIRTLAEDFSRYEILKGSSVLGVVENATIMGQHNALNGLAAFIAATTAGVAPKAAIAALSAFSGVARRMEYKGQVAGAKLFEDFAHHPTAIEAVLATFKARYPEKRLKVLLELGSYTMREGFHWQKLSQVLAGVETWLLRPNNLGGDLQMLTDSPHAQVHAFNHIDPLIEHVVQTLSEEDVIITMSSRGFDGVHEKLLAFEETNVGT